MNKIFKTVWNQLRRCLVAVNESKTATAQKGTSKGSLVSSTAQSSRLSIRFFSLSALASTLFLALPALAGTAIWTNPAGQTANYIGNGGYGVRTQDIHIVNNGIMYVEGVTHYGICEGGSGHWTNNAGGVLYVSGSAQAAGIYSYSNEHYNSGTMWLTNKYAITGYGWNNYGSAKVNSVAEALLNISASTQSILDRTTFKALHNGQFVDVNLGTGQYKTVKVINSVTGTKGAGMTWASGSQLIFTDVVAGTSSAQAILNKLSATNQWKNATVSFTGSSADPNAYGSTGLTFTDLTLAAAKDAVSKGYSGAIFFNDSLELNGSTASLSDIGAIMGFKSVDGVLNANAGLVLTLTGDSNNNYLTTGNTNVTDNAVLTLGNKQLTSGGKLQQVSLSNGALSVESGSFTVDRMSAANNAVVSVANQSTLYAGNLSGTFTTWLVDGDANLTGGTATIASLSGNGTFKNVGSNLTLTPNAIGMDVVNNASLTLDGQGSLSYSLTNSSNLVINDVLEYGAQGHIYHSQGTLTSIQDNLFQNVTPAVVDPLSVINLSVQVPEEVRVVANELFQKYVPGEVADALVQHATFTGGKVVVTGVNLTNTQVADLTQAFKEKLFYPTVHFENAFSS